MLSVLQLTRHLFTKVSVQANPNLQSISATKHYDITVQAYKETVEEDGLWHMAVTVVLGEAKKESPTRSNARLTVHGAFALRADVPEEKRSRIVRANGGGLLFSAAREMLISVASRSAQGPLEPAVFDPQVFLEETPERTPTVAACFGL